MDRYVIEHRALQRQGKCVLCDKQIPRNTEFVTVLTFWQNGRHISISICDDCLDTMIKIRDSSREELIDCDGRCLNCDYYGTDDCPDRK